MTYLIVQIAVCLLLAALLGGLIGWLLRGRGRPDAAAADEASTDRVALDAAQRRIRDLERDLAESRVSAASAPAASASAASASAAAATGAALGSSLYDRRDDSPGDTQFGTTSMAGVSMAGAAMGSDAAGSIGAGVAGAGLFGAPASAPVDDLKAISGIGPTIETQLAGIGVTTYRQIARFTADDVARVNEALGVFQGRIEREEWVAQAARLHRDAYGTDA